MLEWAHKVVCQKTTSFGLSGSCFTNFTNCTIQRWESCCRICHTGHTGFCGHTLEVSGCLVFVPREEHPGFLSWRNCWLRNLWEMIGTLPLKKTQNTSWRSAEWLREQKCSLGAVLSWSLLIRGIYWKEIWTARSTSCCSLLLTGTVGSPLGELGALNIHPTGSGTVNLHVQCGGQVGVCTDIAGIQCHGLKKMCHGGRRVHLFLFPRRQRADQQDFCSRN